MLHEESYSAQLPLKKTQPVKIPISPDNNDEKCCEQGLCKSYSSIMEISSLIFSRGRS